MEYVEAMDRGERMERFVTIKTAAQRLHVSRQLLYKLVDEGKVAAVRISSCVRLPAEEVARLEREGTEGKGVRFRPGADSKSINGLHATEGL